MTIVYDELTWQTQRVGNSQIETVSDALFHTSSSDTARIKEGVKPKAINSTNENPTAIINNPTSIIKETHHVRSGLRLVREQTNTATPLYYPPFERSDYIGVCFVFADNAIARNDLAFKDIYHEDLNITNGFHYKSETLTALNKPLHYVSLQFDSHFIESLNEQQPLPKWLMGLVNNKDGQVLDRISTSPVLRQLAWQVCQMPITRQLSDSLRIESKALDWLAGLIEPKPTYDAIKGNNLSITATKFVVQACDIIHAEYAQPLTINELSLRVGTNASYLKQFFKHHTGQSIHDYLTHYRLRQAQSLLIQQPKLKIQIVAELCGYQAGHFSQLFRDSFGVTPSQYRQEYCVRN